MPGRWRIRCSPTSYITIDNFYTATVYNKGAEVIRMMATIIGRERSAAAWICISQRHDNQAVTIDDFAAGDAGRIRRRSGRLQALVPSGGTPEVTVADATMRPRVATR